MTHVRLVTITIWLASFAMACGGGDDDASSSGGAVVSCDIEQAGLHYCEEAPGSGADTGCPSNMPGFTPGSGCSKSGVTGSCKQGAYRFYLYTSGASSSALATFCPDGGGTAGSGGDDSSTSSGTG